MDEADSGESPARWLRLLTPALGALITVIALVWAVDLPIKLGFILYTEQALAVILGLTFALLFLGMPARRGTERGAVPWYDAAAAIVGFCACVFIAARYPILSREYVYYPVEGVVVGMVLVSLTLEGLRRAVGPSLVVIAVAFLAYGLLGHLVPGALEGRSKDFVELAGFLAFDTVGIVGLPMKVICTVVVLFIFMGQLLLYSGGSEWFTDLASALMGRTRGGSAKIAVIASSLFGTISGSAVSNVASTGVITIPMMRQAGFTREVAGAVEAVASTGGQIMPPVMGAAAFLMAEFLEIAYTEVLLAALLPAILYYVGVFVLTDLEAARKGIAAVPEDQIPRLATVLRTGWYFGLPFVVLVVLLFSFYRTPEESAFAASLTIIAFSSVIAYRGKRMTLAMLWSVIWRTGEASVEIIVIGAMAGIVIGILQGSGLGFALSFVLVEFGEGSLIGLLLVTAGVCILLGMGMPTAGIYLLLATMAAPPLIKLGISPISAHMFVLYYGILSMITPPVAFAAFTAASISGGEPMATGWTACRLGWTAFVVPFLFVYSPSLLMQGGAVEIVIAFASAVAGVWMASAGFLGYLLHPLGPVARLGFVVAGLSLLVPAGAFPQAFYLDLFGAALGAVLVSLKLAEARRARLA